MRRSAIAAAAALVIAFSAPAFAAMNPFMDVPASHWAYDAVAQLAARGVISGYPDGTYKGAKPTTRYEMASALARALATIDMEKASKQDVEMLKRLVVEFKDELDALGVKVDGIDSRVAVLEKDLGGWSISGQFRFDAKFGNSSGMYEDHNHQGGDIYTGNTDYDYRNMVGKNHFDLNQYRIYLSKRINETTTFYARLGADQSRYGNGRAGMMWEHYYITTYLPIFKSALIAGRLELDWEKMLDLYIGNDSANGHLIGQGLVLARDFGMVNWQFGIARIKDDTGLPKADSPLDVARSVMPEFFEQYVAAMLVNANVNERFRAGVMMYYLFSNGDEMTYPDGHPTNALLASGNKQNTDTFTGGIYAGYKFTPAVELKGVYYYQKQGGYYKNRFSGMYYPWLSQSVLAGASIPNMVGPRLDDDDASFWRIMLDVKQDALKFTSLWLEYSQLDNNFFRLGLHGAYNEMGTDFMNFLYMPLNSNRSKIFGAQADQKWNDKWRTFIRYWQMDYDTEGWDDAKEWGIGVGYRLNPAVEFELAYDHIDYGDLNSAIPILRNNETDDHLVRFRTFVTF